MFPLPIVLFEQNFPFGTIHCVRHFPRLYIHSYACVFVDLCGTLLNGLI